MHESARKGNNLDPAPMQEAEAALIGTWPWAALRRFFYANPRTRMVTNVAAAGPTKGPCELASLVAREQRAPSISVKLRACDQCNRERTKGRSLLFAAQAGGSSRQ